jgi:hypothetical protein
MGLTAILQLLNLVAPAVENFVLLIKNESGSTTALISSTQQQNATDQAAIQTWLQQHQGTTPAAKTS